MSKPRDDSRAHLLTVAVEDYFQATALNQLIPRDQWRNFESRVALNTRRALDLLAEFDVTATFFVLGWVADELPEVVREIAERGHEVASKGYYHQSVQELGAAFRDDLLRTRETLESACGVPISGHRVARGSIGTAESWALSVLLEEGYTYDSSYYPRGRSISHEPWRRFPFAHRQGDKQLLEFPLSTWGMDSFLVPFAGGNYFRQFPRMSQRVMADWNRLYISPFNAYFHIWELDPDQPRVPGASLLTRIRQYRNLEKMPDLLRTLLGRYPFQSIADFVGIERLAPSTAESAAH